MGLVYRLDASDLTTMFSDAGKTTQVTDGAAVYYWAPKSGSAVTTDAVQATLSNRPIYRTDYVSTGLPGVEFDGSNDLMTIAHSTGWNTTSIVEVFAAVYLDVTSAGVFRPIITKASTGSWNDTFTLSQSNGSIMFGSPTYNQMMIGERTGAWMLIYGRSGTSTPVHLRYSKAASSEFTPIMVSGSSTTPTTNSSNVQIGFGPGGNYLNGAIGELRVYTGGETVATIESAFYDMSVRWGLMGSQSSGGTSRPSSPFLSQVIG
jgi:hypothetical protein